MIAGSAMTIRPSRIKRNFRATALLAGSG